MATNIQIRKELYQAILTASSSLMEADVLVARLALEVGWPTEKVKTILKDMLDAKVVEIRGGLICEPKAVAVKKKSPGA